MQDAQDIDFYLDRVDIISKPICTNDYSAQNKTTNMILGTYYCFKAK